MWSYSGNPLTSPKDECRFLLGDTNSAAPKLQDEEIGYALVLAYGTQPPPPIGNYLPAAWLADALQAKYANLVDKAVGDLHITYSQFIKNYQAIANKLRMRAAMAGIPVYAGGQSLMEKIGVDADPHRISTAAKIDGMNYARSFPASGPLLPTRQAPGNDPRACQVP